MSSATVTTVPIPTAKLSSGHEIPLIGYGSYALGDDPSSATSAITAALQSGYTHIDCASSYLNEHQVGEAIAAHLASAGQPRSSLFVTSKLWNTNHSPEHVESSVRKSIADLQCDYLDLLLMHWPLAWKHTGINYENGGICPMEDGKLQWAAVPLIDTWRAMESLVDKGLVKSIGVSNFTVILLQDLLSQCRIPPAVNQVELHPYLSQPHLLTYCNERNIHLSAYSPLGRPARAKSELMVIKDPEIAKVAHQVSVDALTKRKALEQSNSGSHSHSDDDVYGPATVMLAWNVMRGVSVLPKSSTPSRIQHNLHAVLELLHQLQHLTPVGSPLTAHAVSGATLVVTKESFMQTVNGLNRDHRYVNLILAGKDQGKFQPQGPAMFE